MILMDASGTEILDSAAGVCGLIVSVLGFAVVIYTLNEQKKDAIRQHTKDRIYQLINAWHQMCVAVTPNTFCARENELLGKVDHEGRMMDGGQGRYFGRFRRMDGGESSVCPPDDIKSEFYNFYEREIGASIPHIFRAEREILRSIDQGEGLTSVEKKELSDVYRSLLSDPQLHLLLYYGLSSFSDEEYIDRLDRYQIFDALTYKDRRRVLGRIPEIARYPRTLELWRQRHAASTKAVP